MAVVAPDHTGRTVSELVDLDGAVALVTGGARGIGEACARRLAEVGAHVVIADMDVMSATATAAAFVAEGRSASPVHLDVVDSASVDAAVDEVWSSVGPIGIVVNAAGIYPMSPFLELDDETWDRIMAVDLTGVMRVSRSVARRVVKAEGRAVIVNISSTSSLRARPRAGAYVAAKHGLNGLTKVMALELGPSGIRVLGVAPTIVATPGIEELRSAASTIGAGGLSGDVVTPPLGRYGLPDDIARVVLFCVCDLSALMTGVTLTVDAGVTLT